MSAGNAANSDEVGAVDMSSSRSFKAALAILQSRARSQRPKHLGKSPLPTAALPNGEPQFTGKPPIQGMEEWLNLLGRPHGRLPIVHIAGTKGKGSTAAMVESFLRHKGLKTGLYTSPHLVVQTERIRINFEPLQEDKFAKYFFEVYEGLGLSEEVTSPRYLQLLALMSFHVFVKEEVDVAIYETHHGGQYDATNVIGRPLVSAITPIGMDHIAQLGPSIENIAWHKAGIIKAGAPALSAPQPEEVVKVLQDRAAEKETSVEFVQPRHDLGETGLPDLQQQNCSLAIAISDCVLVQRRLAALSRQDIVAAMNQFRWPGRFQIIPRSDGTWFLDGAHNDLSIERSAEWFSEVSKAETVETPRVLIYSHLSDSRDGEGMLRRLLGAIRHPLRHIILTTYDLRGLEAGSVDAILERYRRLCSTVEPEAKVWVIPEIAAALGCVRDIKSEGAGAPHVFITGSLYLVGKVLELLDVKV